MGMGPMEGGMSVGKKPANLEFEENRERSRKGLQLSENFQGMHSSKEVMSPRTSETSKNAMPGDVGQYVFNPLGDKKSTPPPKTESRILPETLPAAGSSARSGQAIETSREVERLVYDPPWDMDPTFEKKSESKPSIQKATPDTAGSNHAAGLSTPKQPSIFQFSAAAPHSESAQKEPELKNSPELPAAGFSAGSEARVVATSQSVTPYVRTSLWDDENTTLEKTPASTKIDPAGLRPAGLQSNSEHAGTTVFHGRKKSSDLPPQATAFDNWLSQRPKKSVPSAADMQRAGYLTYAHQHPTDALMAAAEILSYKPYAPGKRNQFLIGSTRPATTKQFVKIRRNLEEPLKPRDRNQTARLTAQRKTAFAELRAKSRIHDAMPTSRYLTGESAGKISAFEVQRLDPVKTIRLQMHATANSVSAAVTPLGHTHAAAVTVVAPNSVAMAELPAKPFALPLENSLAEGSQARQVRGARRRSQARPVLKAKRPSAKRKAPEDIAQDTRHMLKKPRAEMQAQAVPQHARAATAPTPMPRMVKTPPATMPVAPNRPPLMTSQSPTLPAAAMLARPVMAPAASQARASRWVQNDGVWEKQAGTSAPQAKPVELTVNRWQDSRMSDALQRPQREQRPHAWDHAGWQALVANRSKPAPHKPVHFVMDDLTASRLENAKTDQALLGEWDNYVAATAEAAGVEVTKHLSVDKLRAIWEQRARNGK